MNDFITLWLLDELAINFHAPVSLGPGGWNRIYPSDPMRYGLVFPVASGSVIYLAFSDGIPSTVQMQSGAGLNSQLITRFDIGNLITMPLWGYSPSPTANLQPISISFNPSRFRRYLDYVAANFPQSGPL